MRRLQFASSHLAPRGACPSPERFTLSFEGPRAFLRLPSTQNHSLALTQEGPHFPNFSRHSPLVTRHCSCSCHSSPFPNSFISPSYSDSLVTPLFPLDTKTQGGGGPKPYATSLHSLKFFKNFQANSLPSIIFNFSRGVGGYPFSCKHSTVLHELQK